jgi:hypothetical protein
LVRLVTQNLALLLNALLGILELLGGFGDLSVDIDAALDM